MVLKRILQMTLKISSKFFYKELYQPKSEPPKETIDQLKFKIKKLNSELEPEVSISEITRKLMTKFYGNKPKEQARFRKRKTHITYHYKLLMVLHTRL